MAATIFDGPLFSYGNMGQLENSAGTVILPDPNLDRGPSVVYDGIGDPDLRFFFPKDKVQGYTGVVPATLHTPFAVLINTIPCAVGTNNIAASQATTNGTAMTLAGTSLGVTLNVPVTPIVGYGNGLNGVSPSTAAIVLDFGFAFGNCTSGSTTIVVADSTKFISGMPLVIGGVGNSGGTIPLLTNVASITDATHIVVTTAPLATNATAPIGTGNIWGASENGYPVPTAALPYFAKGPGLFLDPRQTIARGLQITGSSGAAGGTFLISGWDVFWQPMTQLLTVAAGASTGWTLKTFKAIASIVPQFTDTHTYTVGTSDVFGFPRFSGYWELADLTWAGTPMPSATGWLAGVTTSPATNLTGDVRGTLQTSTNGGGTGISGGAASNGSLSSLALTGNRLVLSLQGDPMGVIYSTVTNPAPVYGQVQV